MTIRRQVPSATAVIFTCQHCWDEYLWGREPSGRSHDALTCIVGAECEAEFVSHGFEVVPGIVEGANTPGLFCPHLGEEVP